MDRDYGRLEARAEWMSQARCRNADPDELFVQGAAQKKAAKICRHCPVVVQCAAEALDTRVEYGVWGGMTERQRRALLATHPEVSSWALFFEHRRRASSAAVSSPCRSTGDVPQHQHGLEILRLGQPQVQAVVQRRKHRRAAAQNDR